MSAKKKNLNHNIGDPSGFALSLDSVAGERALDSKGQLGWGHGDTLLQHRIGAGGRPGLTPEKGHVPS